LASALSKTEERERRNVAAFLHDQVGQKQALVKIKLGELQESITSLKMEKPFNEIRELVEETIQDTRRLTFELSPPILYELGLEQSIEWLVEQFEEQHNLKISFQDDGKPKPVEDDVRVILFQSVRELLVNTIKHSKATYVQVSVEREQDMIRITVIDNGMGFDTSIIHPFSIETGGFGLFNIRERLRDYDGNLDIASELNKGTCVIMSAPLS
jgi:signal transduction histidine kinase